MRGRKVELELHDPSETNTATGLTTSWSGQRRIKGNLRTMSASKRFITGKQTVYATHRFVCDPAPALTPTEKQEFLKQNDGRRFQIVYFNNVAELGKQWQFDLLEVT